jgi:hypothetical protein
MKRAKVDRHATIDRLDETSVPTVVTFEERLAVLRACSRTIGIGGGYIAEPLDPLLLRQLISYCFRYYSMSSDDDVDDRTMFARLVTHVGCREPSNDILSLPFTNERFQMPRAVWSHVMTWCDMRCMRTLFGTSRSFQRLTRHTNSWTSVDLHDAEFLTWKTFQTQFPDIFSSVPKLHVQIDSHACFTTVPTLLTSLVPGNATVNLRLRELSLTGYYPLDEFATLSRLAPNLEVLRFRTMRRTDVTTTIILQMLLDTMSRLRHFSLTNTLKPSTEEAHQLRFPPTLEIYQDLNNRVHYHPIQQYLSDRNVSDRNAALDGHSKPILHAVASSPPNICEASLNLHTLRADFATTFLVARSINARSFVKLNTLALNGIANTSVSFDISDVTQLPMLQNLALTHMWITASETLSPPPRPYLDHLLIRNTRVTYFSVFTHITPKNLSLHTHTQEAIVSHTQEAIASHTHTHTRARIYRFTHARKAIASHTQKLSFRTQESLHTHEAIASHIHMRNCNFIHRKSYHFGHKTRLSLHTRRERHGSFHPKTIARFMLLFFFNDDMMNVVFVGNVRCVAQDVCENAYVSSI